MFRLILATMLAAVCVGQTLPALDPVAPSAAFGHNGIQIWTASDPDFPSILAAILDRTLASQIQPIVPFSAIVVNKGTQGIAGILLRVTMTDRDGKQSWGNSRLKFEPLPLPVGEIAIVTPDDAATIELNLRMKNSPHSTHPLPASVNQFVSQRLLARGIVKLRPELDSIVLQSGGVLGPDVFDVVGESEARNAAIREIGAQLSNLSLSDAAVQEWFDSQNTQMVALNFSLGSGLLNHAVTQKRSMLGLARSEVQNRGRAAAAQSFSIIPASLMHVER